MQQGVPGFTIKSRNLGGWGNNRKCFVLEPRKSVLDDFVTGIRIDLLEQHPKIPKTLWRGA